ncbi:glycosyltransferase family 61 protein [Komagataeibacter medellinensis]|uniref:Glycosyltransferase 61 catalytic domain-containing protein n=1 Tax=Komagataeibacter medellinensis (strain NBRC 3288 / BCRC 11682 / LMG 1693 / Kondo 51) TaxID=634177 RepID=G2I311_KOMMN|nr:glycosyltransferase family 61 protein [Komagataeibacter medellinensis]BAK82616.1 hypothetical protein GLX_02040 [Komagataeibacter medellinensis NBRC 3288]
MQEPKKEQALLLKTPYEVRSNIEHFFSSYDVIEIADLAEASEYPQARILLCALELTHAADIDTASDFVARVCTRFPMVVFIEPSSDGRAYLAGLGYKSFHENYRENRMFGQINVGFFRKIGHSCGLYHIEHFGIEPTFDVRAWWIVPQTWLHDVDYRELAARPNHVFDETIFNMSAFVVRGFDAPKVSLGSDLELIESRLVQPHARAGGFLLDDFRHAHDLGTQLYATPEDAISLLGGREIHAAVLLDSGATVHNETQAGIQMQWRGMSAPQWLDLSVHELPDCVVGGSGFIFSGRKPVFGSDYLIPYIQTSLHQSVWEGMQKQHHEHVVPGISIMGFNHLYGNYYHFMAEAFNAVSLCLDILDGEDGEGTVSILTGTLDPLRRSYFNILLQGRHNVRLVEIARNEYVRTDRTLYCSRLLGRALPQPGLVAERVAFQKTLLEKTGLREIGRTDRLVYISRQDTKARRILNEDALIDRLRSLGFEILVATGTSLADQIRIFREARLVVAGHGAGVSNMLFAREGTALLELIQASYLNVGPMRLAQIAGCRYYSMLFFEDGPHNGWYVDIDRVEWAIRQLL